MKLVYLLLVTVLCACQGPKGDTGPAIINNGPTVPLSNFEPHAVQFCPDVAPSYPTTFPEVGLCINGSLYAVYSDNGGFLALISPGTYASNAVGSACTFTVLPSCVVQ